MKILMIGLGSIGQRHLRNLSNYFGKESEFLAYRVRGLQRTFSDSMKIREGISVEKEFHIHSFSNLDEALLQKPQVVYVTNITNQHIPCALKAIQAGCDVFLEKPVSDKLEGISQLIRAAKESGKIVFVGFQNRYHPVLIALKEKLHDSHLGKIISVQSEVGERLTTMHTYENYADTYMARQDQGGGVIMNQQIHELDYLQWLFGFPDSVFAQCGKNSNLSLDVEDYCDAIFQMNNDLGKFPVYAHADFFQYPPKRYCKVIFENGWILADLLNAQLTVACGNDISTETFHEFERNHMFIDEMKDFIDSVKTRKTPAITLEDGVMSMRMASAAKLSSKENRVVKLNEVDI